MKKIKNHLHTLKTVTLSEKERELQRAHLSAYRELKPLRPERTQSFNRLSAVKSSGFNLFESYRAMPIVASLLIALSVGGGTAFAAEGSLPGDVLYPIKTEVTENVRAAFNFDAETRAEFEAWRAERRLNEASQLALRAELTDEKRARIEENFNEHAARVEDRIARIAEDDSTLAAELSTKFEASLLAHEAILASFDATTSASVAKRAKEKAAIFALARERTNVAFVTNTHESDAAMATLSMNAETSASLRTSAPAPSDIDREAAAKRMYAAADKSLEETTTLYKRVYTKLTEEEITRIELFFKEKTELFIESEEQYEVQLYSDAYLGFQRVVASMNSLSVYLKSRLYGHIESDVPPVKIIPIIDPIPLPVPIEVDYTQKEDGYIDPIRPLPIQIETDVETRSSIDM